MVIKTLPTSTVTTFQYSPQNYTYNLMTVSFKNMFSSNYAQLYLHLKYTLYAWVGLIVAPKYQKVWMIVGFMYRNITVHLICVLWRYKSDLIGCVDLWNFDSSSLQLRQTSYLSLGGNSSSFPQQQRWIFE